jgi:hypothetical protein
MIGETRTASMSIFQERCERTGNRVFKTLSTIQIAVVVFDALMLIFVLSQTEPEHGSIVGLVVDDSPQ